MAFAQFHEQLYILESVENLLYMVQLFFWSFAVDNYMSSRQVMANGRSFKTSFVSSWKYAGICASLKGQSKGCFRNQVIKKGYVMVSNLEIQGWKILWTIEFWEDALMFGHGQDKLLGDFVQGYVVDNESFYTITFRNDDDGSWPAGVTTTYDLCI